MTDSVTSTQPVLPALYHYSDANGFIGMLTTGHLWFTHIKYLNDEAEYSYALDLLAEVLEEYRGIGTEDHIPKALGVIKDQHNERLRSHYSFSLTEENDLLSQWRGYCPNGGYSFAIDSQHLEKMRITYQLTFEKCLYDKDEQKTFIVERIIGVASANLNQAYELEKQSIANGTHRGKGMDFHTYGVRNSIVANSHLLAFLKHPAFGEEKEWRMVASENSMSNMYSYLKFRSSRNLIIPYLDLPILADSEHSEISGNSILDDVTVSPTPHRDLALASCRMMMHRYQSYKVHSPNIPYRNW